MKSGAVCPWAYEAVVTKQLRKNGETVTNRCSSHTKLLVYIDVYRVSHIISKAINLNVPPWQTTHKTNFGTASFFVIAFLQFGSYILNMYKRYITPSVSVLIPMGRMLSLHSIKFVSWPTVHNPCVIGCCSQPDYSCFTAFRIFRCIEKKFIQNRPIIWTCLACSLQWLMRMGTIISHAATEESL